MSPDDETTKFPVIPTPDWKTLSRGETNSALYTEQSGLGEEDLTWWDGRNVAGVTIGLIQFRANLPMMPGSVDWQPWLWVESGTEEP